MPRHFAMACVLEEVDRLSLLSLLLSPFHHLSVLINYNGVQIEKEWNFSCLLSSQFSSFSMRLGSKAMSRGVFLG
jgi:hypothetical protein